MSLSAAAYSYRLNLARKELERRDNRKKYAGLFSDYVTGKAGFNDKFINPAYFFETIRDAQRKSEASEEVITITETEKDFNGFNVEEATQEIRKHNEIAKLYNECIGGYYPKEINQKEISKFLSNLNDEETDEDL